MLSEKLYYYRAKLLRCIDGDSMEMAIDRGFDDSSKIKVRVARIDCPEVRGESREAGLEAKERAIALFETAADIIIKSVKLDSFGRAISEVYLLIENEWINLSDWLVEQDLAIYKDY